MTAQLIMIIDDEEDIRNAIRDVLEEEGYAVVTAEHGLDALERLRSGTRPMVILLDLMMPTMDGWQFVKEKNKDPLVCDIPILIVTADVNASERASALGGAGYLQKPFKVEALLDAVQRFKEGARG